MSLETNGIRFEMYSYGADGNGAFVVIGDDERRIDRAHGDFVNDDSTPERFPDGGYLRHGVYENSNDGRGDPITGFERALRNQDVDLVALAFRNSDRLRFFTALRACRRHDVEVVIPNEHAESTLIRNRGTTWSSVELTPWSKRQRALKRSFDVIFSTTGLVALAPLIVTIAIAIKLDSVGPVLYTQERTGRYGRTFPIRKFRTMEKDAEASTGPRLSDEDINKADPRVTDVGRILRRTHLDEIPQLWSILRREMSVVGPRPERPAIDAEIRQKIDEWPKRWAVKPGLTGPAQVNGTTGYEPMEKLRYDLEYVERQSFWRDLVFVGLQVKGIVRDVLAMTLGRSGS